MLGTFAKRLGFAREEAVVPRTEVGLRNWMVERLARELKVDATQVATDKSFAEYGLDSRVAVQVSGELEKVVERRLSPALLFEYQTIDEVVAALTTQLDEAHEAF